VGISSCYVLRSDKFFTVNDTEGLEQPSIETQDPTNVTDTDTFKELTRRVDLLSAMAVNHLAENSSAGVPEGCRLQANQTEVGTFDIGSTVVIDPFPSNAVGTPIPGIPQRHSTYKLHRAGLSDSGWAPFQSKHDWEVV